MKYSYESTSKGLHAHTNSFSPRYHQPTSLMIVPSVLTILMLAGCKIHQPNRSKAPPSQQPIGIHSQDLNSQQSPAIKQQSTITINNTPTPQEASMQMPQQPNTTPSNESKAQPNPLSTELKLQTTTDPSQVLEVVQLYRRLHVEMPPETRSELIVELLNDPRERVCLLGFELASRDLSSGGTLSAKAADATVELMSNPLPSIRTSAARLITRLALPDAAILINTALETEQNPAVAQALLRGVERWPSPESRDAVLRWYQPNQATPDLPRTPTQIAAASAAWSISELDLWDSQLHAPKLQEVYRSIENDALTDADLKLIASTGASSDIDRLIALMENPSNPNSLDAARALVITPRGVDQLVNQATRSSDYTPAAAQAIERHRLNPAGIRKLASLKWANEQARSTALIQICSKLEHPQLADAVRIMRTEGTITDSLSIQLLDRLVAGSQSVSARSAPGVVLLAQLELNNERPDRALEILSLLPETGIQPDSALKARVTKATAHIVLTEFDQAMLLDPDINIWIDAIAIPNDQATKTKIAVEILRRDYQLTEQQRALIDSHIDLPEPADPAPDSDSNTDQSTDPEPDSPESDSAESPPQTRPDDSVLIQT